MTPMNDTEAMKTIDDHKHLLELVENKVAIAYFAVANRNISLFAALKKIQDKEDSRELGKISLGPNFAAGSSTAKFKALSAQLVSLVMTQAQTEGDALLR